MRSAGREGSEFADVLRYGSPNPLLFSGLTDGGGADPEPSGCDLPETYTGGPVRQR